MALKETLTGSLVAAVPGVTRDIVASQVNPSFKTVPIAKEGWLADLGFLALGAIGLAVTHYTGDDIYADMGQGMLLPGVAYTAQDVTHYAMQKMQPASTASATVSAPSQVMVAQAQVRPIEAPQTVRPVGANSTQNLASLYGETASYESN